MGLINETGVLTYKSDIQTGTSKAGNAWEKQTIVISCDNATAPYDKIALQVFGQEVETIKGIKVGERVKVSFSISANEYQGKWYNNVGLFKIETEAAKPSRPANNTAPAPAAKAESLEPQQEDLPF